MMRALILAAALLPLCGGVALARGGGGGGNPNVGRNVDTAAGPMAYANWEQLWRAAQGGAGTVTQGRAGTPGRTPASAAPAG